MLNFLLFTIFFLCLLLGPIRGWTLSPDQALLAGAENALRLCLELGPALCLWSMLLELMERRAPFFSLKLRYEGEALREAVLNGRAIVTSD